jgi:zinc transporter ZupT
VTAGATAFVFVAALATAFATGLGALPFALRRQGAGRWLGAANAIAAGVMLGASAGLVIEGIGRSAERTALGAVAGAVFVHLAYRAVGDRDTLVLGALHGADARAALVVVGVMTAHSAAEGIGVGASFGDGDTFGLLIAAAIALQNVPEGLAISLVLVPRGTRVRTAAAWSVFSSVPQPLLAVPAFAFVEQFHAVLPVGLGFAAGAMIWMVGRELLPEALAQGPRRAVVLDVLVSFALMLGAQLALPT